MSKEAKRIKILTLLSMAVGLVCVIAAIVLMVQAAPAAVAGLLGAEGALTIFFGARGALIANVPARMGQLVKLSLIILIVQVLLLVGIVMTIGPDHAAENPAVLCGSGMPCLITLIICLLSRGMTKRAER